MKTSPYEKHENQLGVRLSYLISDKDRKHPNSVSVASYEAIAKRARRSPGFRLKEGRGPGNEALISWNCLPENWQSVCRERLGNPEKDYNPLLKFFSISPDAKAFYDNFQFDNHEYLTQKQRAQYTINASVMEAIIGLRSERVSQRKSRGGNVRGIWDALAKDVVAFQDHLKGMGQKKHTLPSSSKRLKMRHDNFLKFKYDSLIDGRNNNTNAQIVTPQMLKLWMDIYAGQRNRKPTYIEVSMRYQAFLDGELDIINNETGEIYDREDENLKPASESTIYSYQSAWAQRSVTHALRSGDRQKFKSAYEPWHKLNQPNFAGSIISIDDRQPPFEYAAGKRMWFYNAIDLGSEAFTTWVYGDTKEGIILEFYRQMVRNYTNWGLNIPYELECEMSLNSTFKDNLLENGAMFQKVRIEANNARGKRIEAYFRQLRYNFEKDEDGWIARPFALSESNQKGKAPVPIIPKSEIIQKGLRAIERWNNTLHSNQELHPGLTRWEVFTEKQHPELKPTNWSGILPHIGFCTDSSMHLGRITLQGKHRVVGFDGEVALGDKLINIMKRIEGKQVKVYWLDDNQGQVLKSLVYDMEGNLICELLGDLAYNRSTLEQTDEDHRNRELQSSYTASVQGYISQNAQEIDTITMIEKPKVVEKKFIMPGLETYTAEESEPEVLDTIEEEAPRVKKYNTSTASRF